MDPFFGKLDTKTSCAFSSESNWFNVFNGKVRPKTGRALSKVMWCNSSEAGTRAQGSQSQPGVLFIAVPYSSPDADVVRWSQRPGLHTPSPTDGYMTLAHFWVSLSCNFLVWKLLVHCAPGVLSSSPFSGSTEWVSYHHPCFYGNRRALGSLGNADSPPYDGSLREWIWSPLQNAGWYWEIWWVVCIRDHPGQSEAG